MLQADPLPPGWVGKPHALHRLSEAAASDVMLNIDADVTLDRDGLLRMLSLLGRLNADVVTAVPRQLAGSFTERLMIPLLHLSYVAWLPMPLIHRTRDPRVLAANGQLLLIRRRALDSVGGWASVRTALVDEAAQRIQF